MGVVDLGWSNGGRKRRVVTGRTMREVQVKLADLKRRVAAGLRVDRDEQTVEQFLTRWLAWKDAHVRPRTAYTYRRYLEGHAVPALGRLRLVALRVDDVQAMLDARQGTMAPRSLQALRAVLRTALADAVRWGEAERNVAALARGPEVRRERVQALTAAEAKAILQAAKGDRLEAVYTVALAMGLRRSELCGLRWEDVDLEARILRVERTYQRAPHGGLGYQEPKTESSRREIALPAAVAKALRQHRTRQLEERLRAANLWEETGHVFADERGRPLDPDRVTHHAKGILKAAGRADLSLHQLRHGAASLLLAEGVSLKLVQELLGHSTYQITADIYSHVAPELRRVTADAMDGLLGE